ncbi:MULTISPECIES: type 1 glutamine amidotransferase domain-containing protein [Sphingobacterium]|uniref:Type 1 glutamine amidotransferase domain-containing protein n=1 Tax=Sphingobacterium kitahiroshimense TaxID=470446 RepID=A0ABV0BNY3_9SPHI|nr:MULTISPECIES: type 1 glutamine amidotransferase domain-containing protein [unclassified Sphingobacterium]MCS3554109.1 putative intracellular protease/amidase [Sphingobacterium sp. JUb21]NJI74156.1 type 1 glutamine amidotransferase domain-containing protein [Sphingobacterium sp. B16(2022)]QQD16118.1 type 1 glutamine amidotransferase domain-containing protein [Sphingobacterium sp. UDSM-2020]TCR07943.1 putative intracellular protease/amidase [Sphingobacterium sp. JUb20]
MEKKNLKVLVVLTSHDQLGDTGNKTGFWVEEFAAPYYVLADAGVNVTIASPKGGQPPIDPKSALPEFQTEATKRFDEDKELKIKLANSIPLKEISEQDYDAIFYPGGHGPLWDLTNDKTSIALIEAFWRNNKPVAAVCHAPGVLRFVKDTNGSSLVKGKKVTGFSNSEEEAVQLTNVVPFLVEDELVKLGGIYSKGEDWNSYVLKDGNLITGQNPGSSEETAKELLALLAN